MMISNNDRRWMRLMKVGHYLGCHQIPERSFAYKGYQFPVCARCTGVFASFPLSVYCSVKKNLSPGTCLRMCSVMLTDWLLQYLDIKQSNNSRRLITGFIGGLGFNTLYLRGSASLIKKFTKSAREGQEESLNEKEK
jgi:uncharacterized membrane protein